MNTQTHLLIAAAAFARPGQPKIVAAALLGGVLPDLSLFVMVGWSSFVQGLDPQTIFTEVYAQPFWRTIFAIDNSAPLYALLLAVGLTLRRGWLIALAGGALLHIAADLPLHHDDGRPHFLPFTDWVFVSPVSYWDPRHHGDVASLLEGVLALGLAALLWRRFESLPARASIALAVLATLLTGAFWRAFFR